MEFPKRWGGRRLVKTNPNTGVKTYEVERLGIDGEKTGIETIDLQPFLDFCLLCGQEVVDTRKNHGCPLKRNECCDDCTDKCKEKARCLLK